MTPLPQEFSCTLFCMTELMWHQIWRPPTLSWNPDVYFLSLDGKSLDIHFSYDFSFLQLSVHCINPARPTQCMPNTVREPKSLSRRSSWRQRGLGIQECLIRESPFPYRQLGRWRKSERNVKAQINIWTSWRCLFKLFYVTWPVERWPTAMQIKGPGERWHLWGFCTLQLKAP